VTCPHGPCCWCGDKQIRHRSLYFPVHPCTSSLQIAHNARVSCSADRTKKVCLPSLSMTTMRSVAFILNIAGGCSFVFCHSGQQEVVCAGTPAASCTYYCNSRSILTTSTLYKNGIFLFVLFSIYVCSRIHSNATTVFRKLHLEEAGCSVSRISPAMAWTGN